MPNVADLQTVYRIAIRDSGGEERWYGMSMDQRREAMDAVMRRFNMAGIITPAISASGPMD
jgi:hypothetical protein